MSEQVLVDELPNCDLHAARQVYITAQYDGRTKMGFWAFLCGQCFQDYGVGLGTGNGQKLILRESVAGEAVER
jgi:hypothetical protein